MNRWDHPEAHWRNWRGSDRPFTIGSEFSITRPPDMGGPASEYNRLEHPEDLSSPEPPADTAAALGRAATDEVTACSPFPVETNNNTDDADEPPRVSDDVPQQTEEQASELPTPTDAAASTPPIVPPIDTPPPAAGDAHDPQGEGGGEGVSATPTLREIDVRRFDDEPLSVPGSVLAPRFYGTIDAVRDNLAFPEEVSRVDQDGNPLSQPVIRLVTEGDDWEAHFDVYDSTIGCFFTAGDEESDYYIFELQPDKSQPDGQMVTRTAVDLDFAVNADEVDDSEGRREVESLGDVIERWKVKYAKYVEAKTGEDPNAEVEFSEWEVGPAQLDYLTGLIERAHAFVVTYGNLTELPISRIEKRTPKPSDSQAREAASEFRRVFEDHRAVHGWERVAHFEELGALYIHLIPTDHGAPRIQIVFPMSYDRLSESARNAVMGNGRPVGYPANELKLVRTLRHFVDEQGRLQISIGATLVRYTGLLRQVLRVFQPRTVNATTQDVALLKGFLRRPRITVPPRRRRG